MSKTYRRIKRRQRTRSNKRKSYRNKFRGGEGEETGSGDGQISTQPINTAEIKEIKDEEKQQQVIEPVAKPITEPIIEPQEENKEPESNISSSSAINSTTKNNVIINSENTDETNKTPSTTQSDIAETETSTPENPVAPTDIIPVSESQVSYDASTNKVTINSWVELPSTTITATSEELKQPAEEVVNSITKYLTTLSDMIRKQNKDVTVIYKDVSYTVNTGNPTFELKPQ